MRDVVVNDAMVSEQSEAELRALLAGRRVAGLRRRGKYLIVDLSAAESVRPARRVRASGCRRRPHHGRHPPAHDRPAAVQTRGRRTGRRASSGGSSRATDLAFQDVRRFGRLWAFDPAAEDEFFAGMGPEPFGDAFSVAYLRRGPRGPHARRSSRSSSTSGASPASATSTPTRRCSARDCTRCARPGAWGRARRGACTRPCSRPCRRASITRARRSRASSTRPGGAAASRRS